MMNTRRKSQNWGSTFLRTKISREPYLLQKRTVQDLKYWEWAFIGISLLGTLINIGFNLYQLITAIINDEKYVFPIMLIINNIFAVAFLFAGIIQEQPFQILMQLISKTIVWVFNMVYFLSKDEKPADSEADEATVPVKDIRFYVSSSMMFLTIPVGAFVLYKYWTSNMAFFKTVGTEPKYVNLCRKLKLGESLVYLDVQITVLTLILIASKGLSTKDVFSLVVLPLGIVLAFVWAYVGIISMRRELRFLLYAFYVSSHLQPIYVIYLVSTSSKSTVHGLLFYTIITATALFFVCHISLLVVVVQIQLNFGRGLKQAADKETARNKSLAASLAGSAEFLDHNARNYIPPPPLETDI